MNYKLLNELCPSCVASSCCVYFAKNKYTLKLLKIDFNCCIEIIVNVNEHLFGECEYHRAGNLYFVNELQNA